MAEVEVKTLTNKDFTSDQEVRWCPGCGDYAILRSMQKALPQLETNKEDYVFIAGIGCSSRFPYYMNTYGFHTIHGRAPAIATGVKLANPKLKVWQITGDGDALAIGGNHFIHAIRRNIDINIVLFNNEIYGLTKGQFSPTSPSGLKTKSNPHGITDSPFIPAKLALGSGATFIARVPDANPKAMQAVFLEAENHRGTSLIEILQNCIIFNDKCHGDVTGKDVKHDMQLWLEDGKPMIFGSEMNKGIILNGLKLEVVTIGENDVTEDDILIHNSKEQDITLHMMLSTMSAPEFPVAMGVIRAADELTYDEGMIAQLEENIKNTKFKTSDDLFNSGDTWEVN
ncbi:MAG TPA: 2-oxoacid:ferredoxin oxidoreductase subunit beta [Flavobacteriales bacterium]|jgi:2-oxoglutarate ferredoxin oxidoreductase subunit beta|nr:2-oxoacid:ferredoxin oxidoreductase subunit beta [Flavobacteriales bacterium]|tara:strand:- start:417 stop:1439 length:1023 start_codon:yes stop_codon:yes gene_type:complete